MKFKGSKCGGFTLIELTVVILILGMIYGIVIPKFQDITGFKLKAVARKISALVSFSYNEAVSKNKKIRLVFDFGENEDRIWVEEWASQTPQEMLKTKESKEDEAEDRLTLSEKEDLEKAPQGSYSPVSDRLAKKFALPDYVRLKGIYLVGDEKMVDASSLAADNKGAKKGETHYASLVFLPSGFTQNTVIYLTDKKGRDFSIKINPVTGRPTIVDSYVEPKSL